MPEITDMLDKLVVANNVVSFMQCSLTSQNISANPITMAETVSGHFNMQHTVPDPEATETILSDF
jgi:hypothetical protein